MFPTRRIITSGGDVFRDEFSLAFDGSNEYVDCGTSLGTALGDNYAGDLTVSIWFKADTTTDSGLFLLGDHNHGDISIRLESNELRFGLNNVSWERVTPFTDTDNWHHVSVILDGGSESTSLLYLDGVSLGSDPGSFPATSLLDMNGRPTKIGIVHSDCFNGNISEVAIYNKALSASEIKTLYNGREPYNHKEGICSSNLQAWWRMGDGDNDKPSILTDTTTDTTGIIQDMATPITKTELVTGWTNTDYDTFVTSGLDVSSAISDGSASHEFRSNNIDITDGDMVEISFTIAGSLVPSSNLTFKLSDNVSLNSTQFDASITGAGDYHFFALWTTTDSTSYVGIRASSEACNYSMTNFSCKRIAGGKNGFMLNMAANDFEGDTP